MKTKTVLGLSLLFIAACLVVGAGVKTFASSADSQSGQVDMIEPEALAQKLADRADLFLLDVRQPSEYQQDHMQGATLIPLDELASRLSEIPRDKTIVVYCRSGRRSAQAAEILAKNGFKNIENLTGGMLSWNALACKTGHC